MKIQELLENKKVALIRNTDGPNGAFIELNRNADGRVVSFITHFLSGRITEEGNDTNSVTAKSGSEKWLDVSTSEAFQSKVSARKEAVAIQKREQEAARVAQQKALADAKAADDKYLAEKAARTPAVVDNTGKAPDAPITVQAAAPVPVAQQAVATPPAK